jgi:hypothetical protein
VILTLSESSTLSDPNYLFVFENEFNLETDPIYWNQTDTSNFTNRYNEFELIESVTGSTSGGTAVDLSLISGQYSYTVYESVTPTLELSGTTGRIIEEGRMVVAILPSTNETITNTINDIYI